MKKVLVFGTFDGLHKGHIDFFKQAKKYGEFLVVVISRDKTVLKVKGHFPDKSEKERKKDVENCYLVDKAVLGSVSNYYQIIKKIKPDVICLGYDQKSFIVDELTRELKKMNIFPKIFRLKPYYPRKFHSSLMLRKYERKK